MYVSIHTFNLFCVAFAEFDHQNIRIDAGDRKRLTAYFRYYDIIVKHILNLRIVGLYIRAGKYKRCCS